MLQSMGLQKVRCDIVTEQQQSFDVQLLGLLSAKKKQKKKQKKTPLYPGSSLYFFETVPQNSLRGFIVGLSVPNKT